MVIAPFAIVIPAAADAPPVAAARAALLNPAGALSSACDVSIVARPAPSIAAVSPARPDKRCRKLLDRATEPLFDTGRFTRNLEAAYLAMWERHQSGQPPAPMSIDDVIAPR